MLVPLTSSIPIPMMSILTSVSPSLLPASFYSYLPSPSPSPSRLIIMTSDLYLIGAFIIAIFVRRALAHYRTAYIGVCVCLSFYPKVLSYYDGSTGP